jgi:2-dehydropantoate 2-reductase
MRILIFGAGALGSLIGALLSKRHEVHLLARPEHAQAIKDSGLRIEGVINETFALETHVDLEGVPQPDTIFVTVKAYDTEAALDALMKMADDALMVVSLQNGLTNLRLYKSALPHKAVMGVTSMGANLAGPGKVVYAGKGNTTFGHLANNPDLSREAADLFNEVGLGMKGIINASINPLTAILGCQNGALLRDEGALGISRLACNEAAEVAQGIGVQLPPRDPFMEVMGVMKATSKNRSSMLQDLENGKRTEIDEINGEIVRSANKIGVPVPVNQTLWTLVRCLEHREI